ncbi:type II toxin-antitoxin system Phd/YefM family antitoxin [Marivirga sp.]|uniref:type II toxin-antitoxin system Phd/YefM family antitoxin n=1 Tax=Marivirga sp. TaxID=2018662 RepID=UPI002D7E4675|nr:type II toxin-antitoxin system Phd/YefM family antitoxin [Marivirga sp.]HET8860568.1 type II toxin-antitoxin system Phd/YefM family antitoxin [Marivirga sp.]
MKALTISNFRKNFTKYIDEVSKSFETIILAGKNEDEGVVMISISEYNSLKETEHLLSTKANRDRLSESMEQMEKSELIEFNEKDIEIPH